MKQIGPYRLVEELARGGMGVVYRAQAPDGLAVALKLLLSHRAANAQARQRFQAEAHTLARLRHPNVVAIVGVGEHEGAPWIALEYVLGQSLEDRLRTGPLPIPEALAVARDLAKALNYVHTCGVLHRDLKPGNVLLSADGARLTDFGLAKDPSASTHKLTATGAFLGTPGYWPPEQARGDGAAIGPHSDLYGLGAVLYACLTGEPPVNAPTLQAYLMDEVNYQPIPPRTRRPEVPAWLDEICMRCLQRDPRLRPRSAGEVEQALLRGAGPVEPATFPKPALVVALLLTVVASLWLVLWNRPRPVADPPSAQQPTPEPSAARLVAQAVDLRDAERYAEALPLLDQAVELAPEAASVYAYRGEVRERTGQLDAALTDFDRALELDPSVRAAWVRRASVRARLGRSEAAIADYSEAIRLDPENAEAYCERAQLGFDLRLSPDQVLADYARALELDPTLVDAYFHRSVAYAKLGRWAEALADLDQAIQLDGTNHRQFTNRAAVKRELEDYRGALADLDHAEGFAPHDPRLHLNRGMCLLQLGELQRAGASLERAISIDAALATAHYWLGRTRAEQGRLGEAIAAFDATLSLRGDDVAALFGRGLAHAGLGDHAAAVADFDEALTLSPEHALALYNRGNSKAALGRRTEAIEDYGRAIRVLPTHAGAYCNRGVLKRKLGDHAGALADYSRAIQLGPDDFEPLLNRGNLLAELGRSAEAAADFRALLELDDLPASTRAHAEGTLRELK